MSILLANIPSDGQVKVMNGGGHQKKIPFVWTFVALFACHSLLNKMANDRLVPKKSYLLNSKKQIINFLGTLKPSLGDS